MEGRGHRHQVSCNKSSIPTPCKRALPKMPTLTCRETLFITECCGSGGLVGQLCLTVCNTIDCSLPGSSVNGISQTRIMEWVAISSSRGSSQPRDLRLLHCRWILYHWATRDAPITLRFILITTSTTLNALEIHHSTDKEKKFRLWSLT